jgi:hypothetical protein
MVKTNFRKTSIKQKEIKTMNKKKMKGGYKKPKGKKRKTPEGRPPIK